jgi:hypothetical protein
MQLDELDVRRFAALFDGYTKAYGETKLTGQLTKAGKVETKNRVVRGQVQHDHFVAHLDGTGPTIGIIMLREDDTVMFGAIDYDNPRMDHVKAEQTIKEKGLPLVLCRSKSGGGHFYCFCTDPVPARVMQDRLTEWSAMLGMSSKTEKFPKQTSRFNEDDIGNYINLPYHKAYATERYAVIDGRPASLAQFLTAAQAARVPPAKLMKSWIVQTSDLFYEGPPCLQQLEAQGGFVEGTRNDGMFNVVVYLKKRYPDSWKDQVDQYNTAMAKLGSEEIEHLKKSVSRKSYTYRCKLPPINSYCQRSACLARQFGIGDIGNDEDAYREYEIQALTRYDHGPGEEPIWTMEIDGKRVQMNTAQFYGKDEFNKQCMSQIGIVPFPAMTPKKWLSYLNRIVPTADIVQMPEEASPTGQLWEWIIKFCTQKVYAASREEIFVGGKPYRDGNVVWFRITDLYTFLDNHRISYKNQQAVSLLLHQRGSEKKFWNVAGKGVNVWGVKVEDPVVLESKPKVAAAKPTEEF